MSSIRDRITAAKLAALNVVGFPCPFERTRTTELGEDDLPRGILYPVRSTPTRAGRTRLGSPAVKVEGTWLLELRAKGGGATRPDEAVDVLYVWSIAKLVGVRHSDGAGGFLNFDTEEGDSAFSYEEGENPVCLLTVELRTTWQNLTQNVEART